MAKDLGAQVEPIRSRPLDAGPYTFVPADDLVLKVWENGRVATCTPWSRSGSTPKATGILGVDVTSSEDEVTMPSPLVDDRSRLCGADTRRHQQTPCASAVLTSFSP